MLLYMFMHIFYNNEHILYHITNAICELKPIKENCLVQMTCRVEMKLYTVDFFFSLFGILQDVSHCNRVFFFFGFQPVFSITTYISIFITRRRHFFIQWSYLCIYAPTYKKDFSYTYFHNLDSTIQSYINTTLLYSLANWNWS